MELDFLESITTFIKNNKNSNLRETLNHINYETIEQDTLLDLLSYMLNIALSVNNYQCIEIIFTAYGNFFDNTLNTVIITAPVPAADPDNENVFDQNIFKPSLFMFMFFNPKFNINQLALVKQGLPDYTLLRLFNELVRFNDSEQAMIALHKMLEVYGVPTYETLSDMLTVCTEQINPNLANLLGAYLDEISPVVPDPAYLIKTEPLSLETSFKLPENCYDRKEIEVEFKRKENDLSFRAEKIAEIMKIFEKDYISEEFAKLKIYLEGLNMEDLSDMYYNTVIKDYYLNLTDQPEIFRVVGPANRPIDLPIEEIFDFQSHMFICVLEKDLENDLDIDFIDDWFIGNCQMCHRKIKNRYRCVRRPIYGGYWDGCYCSWTCVRAGIAEKMKNFNPYTEFEGVITDAINDTVENYLLGLALVDKFEEEINKIGIYDREVIEEEEKE